jgi:multisubunit Na+/H+ antiporter MnhB subunit
MLRALIALFALGLAALLAWVMLGLPAPSGALPARVAAHMSNSGVTHDVTAVLLNFRGYDTLLEIGVLLLAVLGVLAVRLAAADIGGTLPPPAGAVLSALTNLLVPLIVLVAGYLLWAGAHRPGGAFQAGALLAAAGVLLRLSGRLPALLPPRFWLRAGLLVGFAVFLAVALGVTVAGDALLEYPTGQAGGWILLIEATLTVSIGLILISLFVGAPAPPGESANGAHLVTGRTNTASRASVSHRGPADVQDARMPQGPGMAESGLDPIGEADGGGRRP